MLELAEVLRQVASTYSRIDGGDGQQLLERCAPGLAQRYAPSGWLSRSSRRIGNWTSTPWLGFFDPDETIDPKSGLYVCWIIHEDLQWAAITIQQGTESLTKNRQNKLSIPERLRQDAAVLRRPLAGLLPPSAFADISFGEGARQGRYAAGSIAHQRFSVHTLTEKEAAEATLRYCQLLQLVIKARNDLLLTGAPGVLHQRAPIRAWDGIARHDHFFPKSANEYLVHLEATTQQRSRRHEEIVNNYEGWASERGWTTASPHPIDLRLRRDAGGTVPVSPWQDSILFEAKVVRNGNSTHAVREVIGQLATYPHIAIPTEYHPSVRSAALFSQDVGPLWTRVLETDLNIATVWWENGRWAGGPLAGALLLSD